MGLSWSHILIVLVLFVLLFGRGKISELMGDVAHGIKSFKKGMTEDEEARRREAQGHRARGRQARSQDGLSRQGPAQAEIGLVSAEVCRRSRARDPPLKRDTCSTSVGRSFSSSPWSRSWWSDRRTCPSSCAAIGHYAGKLRRAASDFQRQFEEAMREAEIEEVKKAIESVRTETARARR